MSAKRHMLDAVLNPRRGPVIQRNLEQDELHRDHDNGLRE